MTKTRSYTLEDVRKLMDIEDALESNLRDTANRIAAEEGESDNCVYYRAAETSLARSGALHDLWADLYNESKGLPKA